MKRLLLIGSVAAIIAVSCTKDQLVLVNGIIHGYVRDYYNSEYLSGATIEYQVNEETLSVTSDSTGYFTITGLVPGDYTLMVSHPGYLSEDVYAWIEPLYNATTVKGGDKVDYVENVEANLPALNASISGTVKKYIGPDNILRPASDHMVTVQTNSNYFPRLMSTTTNAQGEFSFENVPAAYVQIYIYPISDVDNYYQGNAYASVYLQPEAHYVFNPVMNRYDAGIYLTSSSLDAGNGVYRDNVSINENIVLNFNLNVSKDQTMTYGYITLTGVTLDPEADITFSGSSVTIDPPTDLTPDTDYTLNFAIYSTVPGDFTSGTIMFHTTP